MMAIARDNNILCDIFCHRPDFGNSPVMVPKGQPRQCGDGHAKTNNQQCIYSKPVTGPSTPQRCDRKYMNRIRICPCLITNGNGTTVSIETPAVKTPTTDRSISTTHPPLSKPEVVTKPVIYTTKWFAGRRFEGKDCNYMCEELNWTCDQHVDWPDTIEKIMQVSRENHIRCDSYCHRSDFGQAPVIVEPGAAPQCDGDTTTGQQCIYAKPNTIAGAKKRCARKFKKRVRICPCLIPKVLADVLPQPRPILTITPPTATNAVTTTSTTLLTVRSRVLPVVPIIQQDPGLSSNFLLAVGVGTAVFGVLILAAMIIISVLCIVSTRSRARENDPETTGGVRGGVS